MNKIKNEIIDKKNYLQYVYQIENLNPKHINNFQNKIII